ncbi:hypothetical protein [Thalassobius sp. Cn5-15]|jgi:hypothetical protein|uniref:GTA head formation protein, RCAP_rcc01685 family n=1 Tax=Thalassobius sp. Cn5-15 TaxID=2917763 RepID=UPI001EF367E2|nr:hypothetical protein [Thalassobius sp. Cn5-15]MCG7492067.1 hypothetical protein [Thalassobius sp. Cn5-15]
MSNERRFEPFECAPGLRLEAHEALTELHVTALQDRLTRLEAAMERLERRLWLTVYGVVAMILAEAAQSLLGLN